MAKHDDSSGNSLKENVLQYSQKYSSLKDKEDLLEKFNDPGDINNIPECVARYVLDNLEDAKTLALKQSLCKVFLIFIFLFHIIKFLEFD